MPYLLVSLGAPPSELRQEQRPVRKEYAKAEAPGGLGLSREVQKEEPRELAKQAHAQCDREVISFLILHLSSLCKRTQGLLPSQPSFLGKLPLSPEYSLGVA